MREITFVDRLFFGIIAVAALFVSYLGFFDPARMDESFTWAFLPPLHARFVASLYLFGGVYLGGCLVARYRSQVKPAPIAVVIFTTLLLLITLLNPKAFDYDLVPPWVWTLSYVVYPLWGIVLVWTSRSRAGTRVPGAPMPAWARVFLLVQAAVFLVAGIALLIAPRVMVDLWPWPIDKGLAQFYGGPFLAYAYCSWAYARKETWTEVATIVPGMFAFTTATVVVSIKHRDLFSASDVSSWVWFTVFGGATVFLLIMCASLILSRASRRPAVAPAT
jgi:hypothetical protein